jgi:hypothetical protein
MQSLNSKNRENNKGVEKVRLQKSLLVFPVIAIVFILISALTVFIPQIQSINGGRKDLEEQKAILEKLVTKHTFMNSINETDLDSQLVSVNRVLPNDKPLFQTVGILMKRTKEADIQLVSYDLSPGLLGSASATTKEKEAGKPGQLAELSIDFAVTGTFDKVYSLLGSLDLTAPLSRTVSLTLTGFNDQITANNEGSQISAKLGEIMYYALPPENIGKLSEPLRQLTQDEQKTLASIQQFESVDLDPSITPTGINELKANPFTF